MRKHLDCEPGPILSLITWTLGVCALAVLLLLAA